MELHKVILNVGKYTVTTESLNSLFYIANLLIDLVENGIDLIKEMVPDDCQVEEEKTSSPETDKAI